jgi:hypothetical protein
MSYSNRTPPYTLILITIAIAFIFIGLMLRKYSNQENPLNNSRITKLENSKRPAYPESNYVSTEKKILPPVVDENEPLPEGAIADEIVLRFKTLEDLAAFRSEANKLGIKIVGDIKNLKTLRVRFSGPDQKNSLSALSKKYAEEDYNYVIGVPTTPNKEYAEQNLVPFGNTALSWLGITENNQDWGKGVIVAVLDTGIADHPTFSSKSINNIDMTEDGYNANDLPSGHGTAVASIIAGQDKRARGIAPSAELLGITVLDPDGKGSHFTVAAGIMKAVDQGAKIINLSLGSSASSQLLQDSVNYAISHDVVIVAATGNDAADKVSYPAAYEGVIAVSPVDADGEFAKFGNTGTVGISAPGVGVDSAWEKNKLIKFTGSSTAAPFVSGTLAAILSQNKNMKPSEATKLMYDYADEAGAPDTDNEYGRGILDVGRIMNRNKSGIYDVAVADIFVPEVQSHNQKQGFYITVQNQGTEWMGNMSMEVMQNQNLKMVNVPALDPGKSFSKFIELNPNTIKQGKVTVTGKLSSSGVPDTNPKNNFKSKSYNLSQSNK